MNDGLARSTNSRIAAALAGLTFRGLRAQVTRSPSYPGASRLLVRTQPSRRCSWSLGWGTVLLIGCALGCAEVPAGTESGNPSAPGAQQPQPMLPGRPPGLPPLEEHPSPDVTSGPASGPDDGSLGPDVTAGEMGTDAPSEASTSVAPGVESPQPEQPAQAGGPEASPSAPTDPQGSGDEGESPVASPEATDQDAGDAGGADSGV